MLRLKLALQTLILRCKFLTFFYIFKIISSIISPHPTIPSVAPFALLELIWQNALLTILYPIIEKVKSDVLFKYVLLYHEGRNPFTGRLTKTDAFINGRHLEN